MNKLLATNILQNVIMGYCEDSVGSNEYEEERKQIDEAWEFMQKAPDNSYYQIRYEGSGDFKYFILDPQCEDWSHDPENLKEMQDIIKEASIDMGVKMWIVRISEEIVTS